MMESVGIPIILKAVDFLFETGKKILDDRKNRKNQIENVEQIHNNNITNSIISNVITSKEEALKQPIDKLILNNYENKIKHLLSLLDIYTKNYYLAKEQYAMWTGLVPPIVVHNLEEAENQIASTTKELQTVLSKVYNKNIIIPEV
jgi:hypothetical protein